MFVRLRVVVREDALRILKGDPVLARECGLSGVDPVQVFTAFEVVYDSEVAQRVFALSQSGSGLEMTAVVELEPDEVEEVDYFKLYGRKVIHESDRDGEINRYFYDLTEGEEHVSGFEIKIPRGAVLSKIRLRPDTVAYLGEVREDFVVSSLVTSTFRRGGLQSFDQLPILNLRNMEPHQDFYLLFTRHVMRPAVLDISTPKKDFGIGVWPHVSTGLLSYRREDLSGVADFNRTAEPWGGLSQSPFWIVSRRVRNCFLEGKLKGWDFHPVLEAGSELHARYLALWSSLLHDMARNARNRLSG